MTITTPAPETTNPPGGLKQTPEGLGLSDVAERFGLLGLTIALAAVFWVANPDTFGTTANLRNIASSQAIQAILGLAIMMPLLVGRFDVSSGSILGMTAVMFATFLSDGWPLVVAAMAALAIGTLIGLINGVIVAYLGVNSIIATIGMATILGGLVQAKTQGIAVSEGVPAYLTELNVKSILGIPLIFILAIIVCAIVAFAVNQTSWGRKLTAAGSNIDAARLSGLSVRPLIVSSFATGGLLAAFGGLLQVTVQGSGDPSIGGLAFILPSLAAVFLGATTWRPGTYNVPGMVLALFFIGVAVSGLVMSGVAPWVNDVFNGASVLIAIVISAQLRRRRTGQFEVGS